MGIYIKDMGMPKSCWGCTLDKKVDCAISLGEESSSNFKNIRHPNCPLIEVKEPHGKLVDSDMLYASIAKDTYLLTNESDSRDYGMFLIDIRKKVDKTTTVIERNK